MTAPRKHELPQTLVAVASGGCAAFLAAAAVFQQETGEQISPWTWVIVGILAVIAVTTYEWDVAWRALHPPMTFEPSTLPPLFDWRQVNRRMAAYRNTEGADDSPEELDSVYLIISDTVTLEFVDVVREMLASYSGSISWHPSEPELGSDQSGRMCFVASKEAWKLDPPVVLPSPHRNELILVDRIVAQAKLRDDGPWRCTVMHGRVIDRSTGEVDEHRCEFFTAPGVGEFFGPRHVIGT